jgi:hypothetical protein
MLILTRTIYNLQVKLFAVVLQDGVKRIGNGRTIRVHKLLLDKLHPNRGLSHPREPHDYDLKDRQGLAFSFLFFFFLFFLKKKN